jgi:hypothetical protein
MQIEPSIYTVFKIWTAFSLFTIKCTFIKDWWHFGKYIKSLIKTSEKYQGQRNYTVLNLLEIYERSSHKCYYIKHQKHEKLIYDLLQKILTIHIYCTIKAWNMVPKPQYSYASL